MVTDNGWGIDLLKSITILPLVKLVKFVRLGNVLYPGPVLILLSTSDTLHEGRVIRELLHIA